MPSMDGCAERDLAFIALYSPPRSSESRIKIFEVIRSRGWLDNPSDSDMEKETPAPASALEIAPAQPDPALAEAPDAPQATAAAQAPATAEGNAPKPVYHSYKKKYLKMRHKFREMMRESNTLLEEEQQLEATARRLKEGNDQLLELLLDINDLDTIPAHLRFDLRSPPPEDSAAPDLVPDRSTHSVQDIKEAEAALQEARMELASGQIDHQSYKDIEASLIPIIKRLQTLASLEKTSHSTLTCVPKDIMPPELTEEHPIGFLSPAHEEEYLARMDAWLDTNPPDDQPLPPKPPKLSEREREKNLQLNNPVSVYNWLSKHNPKVFLDSAEDASHDKPPKQPKASPKPTPTASRASKRDKAATAVAAAATVPVLEEEMLDEDGNVVAGALGEGTQKKRKRGADDDAYRPKGGSSRKRKRGGSGVGSSKKGDAGEE